MDRNGNGWTGRWTGLLDVFSFFLYSKLVLYLKARIFNGQKVNINLKFKIISQCYQYIYKTY